MEHAFLTNLNYNPELEQFSYFELANGDAFTTYDADNISAYIKANLKEIFTRLEDEPSRKVIVAITAPIIERLEDCQDLLSRIKQYIAEGRIEMLATPAYGSMSMLFSKSLFTWEVKKQTNLLVELMGVRPKGFVNPAMIYAESMAILVASMKFDFIVAPRISWFLKGTGASIFRSKHSELNIVVPDPDYQNVPLLSSEQVETLNHPVYYIPDLVAFGEQGEGIDNFVGNNLQRDFLAKLTDLSKKVGAEDNLKTNLLKIGTVAHFSALANSAGKDIKYNNYTTLLNLLYNLEIMLR